MKEYKILFVLGAITLITPFLGIPSVFRTWINIIVAVSMIAFALIVRSSTKKESIENQESNFIQENSIDVDENQTPEEYVDDIKPDVFEEAEEFEEEVIDKNNE